MSKVLEEKRENKPQMAENGMSAEQGSEAKKYG